MINREKISFVPLTENDLSLLHYWFQKPHVKKWYAQGQHFSLEMIEEKYGSRINNPALPNYIIYANSLPIGYIQFYQVKQFLPEGIDNYNHPLFHRYDPSQLVGIDLFIAEEDYLHKGFGSRIIENLIKEYLMGRFCGLIVDPKETNTIARSFFVKNGFVLVHSVGKEHVVMLRVI